MIGRIWGVGRLSCHSLWKVEWVELLSGLSGHSLSFVVEGWVVIEVEWVEWSFVVDGGVG